MNKTSKTVIGKKVPPTTKNDNNNIHVGVVYGGMSNERDVSLMSKDSQIKTISSLGYQVTPIDMGYDIASHLEDLQLDIVFNGLYGTYGEDGCLPGLLEIMGIKYTHSNVLSSSVGMDKIFSTAIAQNHNIKCPERIIIHKRQNHTKDPMPRPYVIKPLAEGSSVGVELIFAEDKFDIADYKWQYGDTMIVEKYIPGIEIQAAVFNGKAIGSVEIEPIKNRFYDKETKYTDGMAVHHIPPRISQEAIKNCLKISERIHKLMNCQTISRVDFRYNPDEGKNGTFYFLEINTHPGMTSLSLVPEICQDQGISFAELIDKLIKDGLNR